MKKLSFLILFGTIVTLSSQAQEFKPFKVDLSLGYASPGGTGAKGGVLFAVEPKYAVIPQLSVGLRMEGAVVARFSGFDDEGNANNASVKAAGSYLATGDYYFRHNKSFRPFTGVGLGIFSIAGVEVNSTAEGASAQSKFGTMVRTGFEFSHFRFGVEYNIVGKTKFEGFDSNGDPATLESTNGYLGVKIGVCIGGGRRSSK
jgi:hypothetical protein